jgi:hypothetical protein
MLSQLAVMAMSRFKVLNFSVVDPGSRILNFIHPGSRIKQQRKRGEKM